MHKHLISSHTFQLCSGLKPKKQWVWVSRGKLHSCTCTVQRHTPATLSIFLSKSGGDFFFFCWHKRARLSLFVSVGAQCCEPRYSQQHDEELWCVSLWENLHLLNSNMMRGGGQRERERERERERHTFTWRCLSWASEKAIDHQPRPPFSPSFWQETELEGHNE